MWGVGITVDTMLETTFISVAGGTMVILVNLYIAAATGTSTALISLLLAGLVLAGKHVPYGLDSNEAVPH